MGTKKYEVITMDYWKSFTDKDKAFDFYYRNINKQPQFIIIDENGKRTELYKPNWVKLSSDQKDLSLEDQQKLAQKQNHLNRLLNYSWNMHLFGLKDLLNDSELHKQIEKLTEEIAVYGHGVYKTKPNHKEVNMEEFKQIADAFLAKLDKKGITEKDLMVFDALPDEAKRMIAREVAYSDKVYDDLTETLDVVDRFQQFLNTNEYKSKKDIEYESDIKYYRDKRAEVRDERDEANSKLYELKKENKKLDARFDDIIAVFAIFGVLSAVFGVGITLFAQWIF